MSEAPKKIWVTNAMQSMIPRADPNDPPFPNGMKQIRSTIYIRADIVEEMREALEWISKNTTEDWEYQAVAISALKRLEEK